MIVTFTGLFRESGMLLYSAPSCNLMKTNILIILLTLTSLVSLSGQNHKVRVYGYVIDSNNRGIEDVSVFFEGKNNGTSTNHNGYYDLNISLVVDLSNRGNPDAGLPQETRISVGASLNLYDYWFLKRQYE